MEASFVGGICGRERQQSSRRGEKVCSNGVDGERCEYEGKPQTAAGRARMRSRSSLVRSAGNKEVSSTAPDELAANILATAMSDAENNGDDSKMSSLWEMDFYSRPVLGPDGKKRWELIIVDQNGELEHIEEIPSSVVNSNELRTRIQAVIDAAPVKPSMIRFFRSAMQNMITIALSKLTTDVEVVPSRRTYRLNALLRNRERDVYPNMLGYRADLKPDARLVKPFAQKMPDALRGERYAFVSLPYGTLQQLSESPPPFGELCPVDDDVFGVSEDMMIPGLVIFSKRSKPIAAWMSGLEMAEVACDLDRKEIKLACDLATVYLFARISGDQVQDARRFESEKKPLDGIHFVAVSSSEDSDEIDGFWLMVGAANNA